MPRYIQATVIAVRKQTDDCIVHQIVHQDGLGKQLVLQVKKSEAGTGDPIFKQLPEPDTVPASRQLDLS